MKELDNLVWVLEKMISCHAFAELEYQTKAGYLPTTIRTKELGDVQVTVKSDKICVSILSSSRA